MPGASAGAAMGGAELFTLAAGVEEAAIGSRTVEVASTGVPAVALARSAEVRVCVFAIDIARGPVTKALVGKLREGDS